MLWIELSIIEFVNTKRLRMFRGYSKLPMKKLTKSKILKLEFLLMIIEIFKMKPNVTIFEMFTRFMDAVNGLEGLGNRVSEEEKVYKILRCLSPKWNSKMEAIEEAMNLKELSLEQLIGSLMTYEMKIARQEKEMQKEEDKKRVLHLKLKKRKS